jgi:hypothetical protein
MISKLGIWLNKIFKGWKIRTFGDMLDEYKYMGKKELIKNIVNTAGQINKSPAVIDREYENKLRNISKKALLKTLMILKVECSNRLRGIEPCQK